MLGDMFAYDPENTSWIQVSATIGAEPSPRYAHGFTSQGNKLYLHGGLGKHEGMALNANYLNGHKTIPTCAD
jgi:hypothetical protein